MLAHLLLLNRPPGRAELSRVEPRRADPGSKPLKQSRSNSSKDSILSQQAGAGADADADANCNRQGN